MFAGFSIADHAVSHDRLLAFRWHHGDTNHDPPVPFALAGSAATDADAASGAARESTAPCTPADGTALGLIAPATGCLAGAGALRGTVRTLASLAAPGCGAALVDAAPGTGCARCAALGRDEPAAAPLLVPLAAVRLLEAVGTTPVLLTAATLWRVCTAGAWPAGGSTCASVKDVLTQDDAGSNRASAVGANSCAVTSKDAEDLVRGLTAIQASWSI